MEHETVTTDQNPPTKVKLEPGLILGKLTILSRNGKDTHGNAVWLCKCQCCGKDKNIRADNLKAGRTKSCGCQQHATTTGRRNQMSNVSHAAGIQPRFRVIGYFAPPVKKYGKSLGVKQANRKYSFSYAVIYVLDQSRPDYYNGDLTMYYTTLPSQRVHVRGNQNELLGGVMRRMRNHNWVSPQGFAPTYKRWAEIEGVSFRTVKVSDDKTLFAQQTQMSHAAHPNLRGRTLT